MANLQKIRASIEKMSHYDADERVMATSDMTNELLQTTGLIDQSLQVPIRDVILRALEDKSGDVKTAALKCLSDCVQKFNADHIVYIMDKLGQLLSAGDDEKKRPVSDADGETKATTNKRDIADGIKTILAAVDADNGKLVTPKLVVSLLAGLSRKAGKDTEMEMVCLDVLKDLLERYGAVLTADQCTQILNALTKLLEHPNESVRLRACVTLAPLMMLLSDATFQGLMKLVIQNIDRKNSHTYIQCIGVISQSAGVRVGPFLPNIVPKFVQFCRTEDKENADDEHTLQLWENCLQALSSIIQRCPNKVTEFVPDIVDLSLQLMTHDPNYQYDDDKDADMGGGGGGGGDGWGGDEGGDDWGGGDDSGGGGGGGGVQGGWLDPDAAQINQSADDTWKVRRAAVSTLSAFIRVRSDILKKYYEKICNAFIDRFKERDSNVKEDILLACRDLLREAVVSRRPEANDEEKDVEIPQLIRTRSTFETMDLKARDLVLGCEREMKTADVRTQKALFAVLSELCIVRQGELQEFFPTLIPHVLAGVEKVGQDRTVNADALKFLHLILEFHSFEKLQRFIGPISASSVKAINEGLPLNLPAALRVVGSVARMIANKNMNDVAMNLYRVTMAQLVQKDVNEKIKIQAIATMAIIIAAHGSILVSEVPKVLPVFVERMGNETTRQPALRAIHKIANSDSKVDLSSLLRNNIAELCTFFRKNQPGTRHSAAKVIEALFRTLPSSVDNKELKLAIDESVNHISDADLQMCAFVLDLISTSLTVQPVKASDIVSRSVVPVAIKFAQSPLLQGIALNSLINFFQACLATQSRATNMTYASLLGALLGCVNAQTTKTSVQAVAKCVSGLNRTARPQDAQQTVQQFITDLKSNNPVTIKIALYTIGEIGSEKDLSDIKGIQTTLFSIFDHKNDDCRSAAAFALGNVACGNMETYLPIVLQLVAQNPTKTYLLLTSLKEIIATHSKDSKRVAAFSPHVDTVTPVLFANADHKDEGARGVVAECLGRMAVIASGKILPHLEKMCASTSASARAAAITALRFSFTDNMDWLSLGAKLSVFLNLLKDRDLQVRKQALATLNSLLRANVEIVRRDQLHNEVLPTLFLETKINPALLEEVDYVAFKQTVDHGLPLRKSAYECLTTLLELAPKKLDMPVYVREIQKGLADTGAEIQIATFHMFQHIAKHHASSLLEVLDSMPTIIMPTVKSQLATAKTKDGEMAKECLRSLVQSMVMWNLIPGVESCTKYMQFFKQVCATPLLAGMLKEIEAAAGGSGEGTETKESKS